MKTSDGVWSRVYWTACFRGFWRPWTARGGTEAHGHHFVNFMFIIKDELYWQFAVALFRVGRESKQNQQLEFDWRAGGADGTVPDEALTDDDSIKPANYTHLTLPSPRSPRPQTASSSAAASVSIRRLHPSRNRTFHCFWHRFEQTLSVCANASGTRKMRDGWNDTRLRWRKFI